MRARTIGHTKYQAGPLGHAALPPVCAVSSHIVRVPVFRKLPGGPRGPVLLKSSWMTVRQQGLPAPQTASSSGG